MQDFPWKFRGLLSHDSGETSRLQEEVDRTCKNLPSSVTSQGYRIVRSARVTPLGAGLLFVPASVLTLNVIQVDLSSQKLEIPMRDSTETANLNRGDLRRLEPEIPEVRERIEAVICGNFDLTLCSVALSVDDCLT